MLCQNRPVTIHVWACNHKMTMDNGQYDNSLLAKQKHLPHNDSRNPYGLFQLKPTLNTKDEYFRVSDIWNVQFELCEYFQVLDRWNVQFEHWNEILHLVV